MKKKVERVGVGVGGGRGRVIRVERTLWALLDKMACAYGTTRLEALRALRAADEIVYVNGVFRFIKPTKPDGRIVG